MGRFLRDRSSDQGRQCVGMMSSLLRVDTPVHAWPVQQQATTKA